MGKRRLVGTSRKVRKSKGKHGKGSKKSLQQPETLVAGPRKRRGDKKKL